MSRSTARRSPISYFRDRRSPFAVRRGLTLIEILVSLALVSVILVIVMGIFGAIAGAVAENRAMIEMVDRQAAVLAILQSDLNGRTVQTIPWTRDESASGYIEYVEGGGTDKSPLTNTHITDVPQRWQEWAQPPRYIFGDIDDVLMLTVRSRGKPFVGRYQGKVVESYLAEVVWWVAPAETETQNKPPTLYRRVLLIRPDLDVSAGGVGEQFFRDNDISARRDEDGTRGGMIANSLADLTHPENRFSHTRASQNATGRINLNRGGVGAGQVSALKPFPVNSDRYGQDVMLTNCVGFDVKIFDPRANVISNPSTTQGGGLIPGDLGYSGGSAIGTGAYCDLGQLTYSGSGNFSRRPRDLSRLSSIQGVTGIYDTWSFHYEHDGQAQAGGTPDRSIDGQGFDDARERETSPPYPFPLRGLQIKLRSYDPNSRQVRESSIVGDFLPR